MSYDLILYFNCGCTGNIHKFDCSVQVINLFHVYCGSTAINLLNLLRKLQKYRRNIFNVVLGVLLASYDAVFLLSPLNI